MIQMIRSRLAIALAGVLLLLVGAPGCATSPQNEALLQREPASSISGAPQSCVAIRGNGELIMAHFNSLAHLVEHYGLFDGLSGGSSASVSIFIYESIIQNPALRDCPGCSKQDIALRASLLLKTLWAYFDVVKDSDDARAVFSLMTSVEKLQKDFKTKGLGAKLQVPGDAQVVAKKLIQLLEDSEITGLINPEILKTLKQVTTPKLKMYQVREVQAAIATFGKFKAEDKKIFFRPGLISFAVLAQRFGRVGNFYAGRGGRIFDRNGVKHFLDTCAPGSMDHSWKDLIAREPGCGTEAFNLIRDYREKLIQNESISDSRLKDQVGQYAHILVNNGILEAPAAAKWREGLRLYRAGDDQVFDAFQFKIYDQMQLGYWGQESDIEKVARNPRGFTDLKTSKRITFSAPTWLEALTLSPAEPGLSPFQPIGRTGLVSAAGWTDLSPTLVLRNMGCQKVTYVTRQGNDSPFGTGVARNLGMTSEEENRMYNLDNPNSSLSLSIKAADGVWCTNWDTYPVQTNLPGMDRDSYAAAMESERTFKMPGFSPYAKQIHSKHRGCGGMVPVEKAEY